MLALGNKELKSAYIGSKPIKQIYLGSKLVWPTKFAEWFDPEFKRVALAALNNGNEMTDQQIADITNEQFAKVSFKDNTDLRDIRDLGKFTSVDTIPDSCFYGCSSLGLDETTLTIPQNITKLQPKCFNGNNTSGNHYKSIVFDHKITMDHSANWNETSACFGNMRYIEGILDLTNLEMQNYHEFDGVGLNGSGVKVILTSESSPNSVFGSWFPTAKVIALADSEANLEDGVIKIPSGFTATEVYCFNASVNNQKFILPEGLTSVGGFGGDLSWQYVTSYDLPSTTKVIKGPVGDSIQNNITIICRAATPPEMQLGGIGWGGNYDKMYPFYNTKITAIYVPDDSVEAYKTNEINTECWNGSGDAEIRNIGWSRFADKIKPLSDV